MNIKICGITNIADALFAEKHGADYLGFVFSKTSKRFIASEKARGIMSQLTRARTVGVFVDDDLDEIEAIANRIGLDAVQVYAPVTRRLKNVDVIQAVKVEGSVDSQALAHPFADFYLLDAARAGQFGGLGLRFDWSMIPGGLRNIFLAGGISMENIEEALRQPVYALDVSSSVEVSPGVKDHQKLKALLERVKQR